MSDCVVIDSGPDPDATVILLHGLGADGHDFAPVVQELGLPAAVPVRFRFPHAPSRPVTINGGISMPAWFDILGLDRDAAPDEVGIRGSMAQLDRWVEEAVADGFARERIVVAGFSQGGAIALSYALRSQQPLAGVMALSTYLPLQQSLLEEHAGRHAALPIFMAHGTHDPVLPLALAVEAREFMRAAGYTVEWHEFPMPHSVCAEEIVAMRAWLVERLAPGASA
ncbi:MAG: alpha/beta fold hydrolase [Pseudomonadota bacterium]